MAVSPNNGAFLLNLALPIVTFVAVVGRKADRKNSSSSLSFFAITIVNDETLRLTRELDIALNTAKIFTHTPVRS